MKRPILIIVSVVVAFVLIGTALMTLFGPYVGTTYNSVSNELPGYGGGAPESVVVQETINSAPVSMRDQAILAFQVLEPQKQERMVI